MTRPCDHPTGPTFPDSCKVCWKYENKPEYRELWDTSPPRPDSNKASVAAQATPCAGCPGTELKSLLASWGITENNCECNHRAALMNTWGVEGCRQHLNEIVQWLKVEAAKRGWLTRLQAGWGAVRQVGIRLTDPYTSLVSLAIQKAEEKEAAIKEQEARERAKLLPIEHKVIDAQPEEQPTQITTDPTTLKLSWAYGVTTVPERRDALLKRTLASLKLAGFPSPRLFVDNCKDPGEYKEFGLEITTRHPRIRTHMNWVLALYELYGREPNAQRYALFQDDFVTYRNLCSYLEQTPYPDGGRAYLNLYTFPSNQALCPKAKDGNEQVGWYPSNQLGRGAVALVFSREATLELLCSRHMVDRPMDPNRGHKAVDGGIVTALKKVGYREYVHNPSLVQHMGDVSVMGNKPHQKAGSFRGEDFDALNLLK